MPIDPNFLEVLRCPRSRAPLIADGEWLVSTDRATRVRYRIVDEIPDFIEGFEELSLEAWQAIMDRQGAEA